MSERLRSHSRLGKWVQWRHIQQNTCSRALIPLGLGPTCAPFFWMQINSSTQPNEIMCHVTGDMFISVFCANWAWGASQSLDCCCQGKSEEEVTESTSAHLVHHQVKMHLTQQQRCYHSHSTTCEYCFSTTIFAFCCSVEIYFIVQLSLCWGLLLTFLDVIHPRSSETQRNTSDTLLLNIFD